MFRRAIAVGVFAFSKSGMAVAAEMSSGTFSGETIRSFQTSLRLARMTIVDIAFALPSLPDAIWQTLLAMGEPSGGHALIALIARLLVTFLVALGTVRLLRHLLDRARKSITEANGTAPGTLGGLCAIGFDLVDRLGVAVVAAVGIEFQIPEAGALARFGFAIAFAGTIWWLVMLLVDVLFRPRAPAFRLIGVDDAAAKFIWRTTGVAAAIILAINRLLPQLIDNGFTVAHAQALVLVLGTAMTVFMGATVRRAGISGSNVIRLSRSLLFVFWLALFVGVVRVDLSIIDSFVLTIVVIALAVLIDRLIGMGGTEGKSGRLRQVVRRCTRVGAFAIVISIVAETWLVGQFEVLSPAQWHEASRSSFTSVAVLFAGYLAWEAMRHWIDRKIIGAAPVVGPGGDGGEVGAASRFTTLLPLFRTFGTIAIFVLTLLVALSEWGVNIVPLLAGASIFGLAISFGSQALVRDIVSGIFFIADDAFRVGEYVDTGKLKGTVEAITVRSVKLRHQSGQVHTIPFGQLQYVTNFSRDWATVKFNLRLARDSDVEKIRKAIKRIGVEMQEDAEIAPELIEPLKLQGVADIVDNALIVRLKFTARPVKPSWVQREALKRIHNRFREVGIEFASNAVTVQTSELVAGGAAAAAKSAGHVVEPTPGSTAD